MDLPRKSTIAFVLSWGDQWQIIIGGPWNNVPSQTLITWMKNTQKHMQESYDKMRENQDPLEIGG